jgi:hypothetical protein
MGFMMAGIGVRWMVLSCYRPPAGDRLYIITEWDRSMTTVMLPSEY